MSTKPTIQTRCPKCDKAYEVPAQAVGRRARCSRCQSEFRVSERVRHPTEEDILRWLSEVEEPDVIEPPVIVGRREDRAGDIPKSRPDAEPAAARRLEEHAVAVGGAEHALRTTG